MSQPDALCTCFREAKSEIDVYVFKEAQLLDRNNNNMCEEENPKDMEPEGIDMARWEKKIVLYMVPQEYRLELLRQ